MMYLMEYADWLRNFLIVFSTVAIAVSAHYFLCRRGPSSSDDKEIATVVSQLVGTLYTMLLAFIAVTGWGDFDRALSNGQIEIDSLADLYRLSEHYSTVSSQQLKSDILKYATLMPEVEWPAMQHGGESKEADRTAGRIADTVSSLAPKTIAESNVQQTSLSLVHSFLDARRVRLNKNQVGMPLLLRMTIFSGAILMFGFTFVVYTSHKGRQLIMTAILGTLVGIVLALIFEFEYPYRGNLIVPSTGWSQLKDAINTHQVY